MQIDIISLFPEMFAGPFGQSITKRAIENNLLNVQITNPRQFAYDKHQQVDDAPFGGGNGMVLKPEPFFRAVKHIKDNTEFINRRIVLMCPSGQPFTQAKAKELAGYDQLIFVCGHYEGFDARITDHLVDEAISIGDYVLTGGELPAMVIVDALSRMLPGVLGSAESAPTDSFYAGLLECPQYTRPREYHGFSVPDILLSGDHAKINLWRRREALRVTLYARPDLLEKIELDATDLKLLAEIKAERRGS
ncbi:tRNA (guanine37-N1)-methyltransferase [Propionispira arboris]|uniref:tRNA (guanine-N(1)-)-methyltransferase n=1 Tax=Propionispira arboris TaxID=84035 RepID=A0A1H6VX74_9FIRM|nr:tRNA (guanosine(37)-N1)-methyltransferase TrmD [Propionispira arboris]SEJ08296.1 tRNA (guanine37-N1)-methyltransferase [Propionispira arboris]